MKTGKTQIKWGCNAEHMQVEECGQRRGTLSLRVHHPIIFGASVKKCIFFHRPTFEPVALSG